MFTLLHVHLLTYTCWECPNRNNMGQMSQDQQQMPWWHYLCVSVKDDVLVKSLTFRHLWTPTTTRVKSQSTNTLWRLITALRPSCCIWKGTMQSFLKSITQILLDIFIWLCSKKEMLFDFCLQSCTLLLNAATVSCKRAKAALTTLKCGWLPLVCFKALGLTKTWFKCSVVISILVLGAQEYWASKGNLPHSKNEYT